MIRVGIGYDSHRLVEGRKLIIGGVEIPFHKGLEGHSDADVLTHAIMDSLLGALSLPDIGQLFPDSNPEYKDVRSIGLLKKVARIIDEKNYEVVGIDTVLVAEEPKISQYKEKIKQTLSRAIGISPDRIGIKAKTNEGIGEIGKGEGILCYAVAVLRRKND
ncbi:MAG: 2-C-methyl-D-erythritol 2,4-cyclodiphosphate synthase [Candidatus Aminicenantes bacterium]|nr:2-C-methyl-D-erythritol 2,4-cyclodiphosphate synthase [Candidatus Aminicenantes bacterium]